MNSCTFAVVLFGFLAILLSAPMSASIIISCPPNASAKMRELCSFALEQYRTGTFATDHGDMVDTPIYDRGTKRQDVDHVFLRFGRRLGL